MKVNIKTLAKRKVIQDMPHLQKKMKAIDEKRLLRIKEAKENKAIRKLIKLWAEEKTQTRVIDDKQRLAINLMVDFVRARSYQSIADYIGVSVDQISNWRNDPVFLAALNKEITRRKSFIRLHAFRNVHRAVLRGDMKATWNYLKMSGDLKENIDLIDPTGETEMDDTQLEQEIATLSEKLISDKSDHLPKLN